MTEEQPPEDGTTPTPQEPTEAPAGDVAPDIAALQIGAGEGAPTEPGPAPGGPADVTPQITPAADAEPAKPISSRQRKDWTKPTPGNFHWGTGRRKTAVARVRIRPGTGEFKVNKRDADAYFHRIVDRRAIRAPLEATNMLKKLDVFVNIKGGGTTGQAGAIILGIARAINHYDSQYEQALRDGGFLTRDSRRVERKKYGQRGARRRFQFSKR